jgi:hypothetical protein
VNLQHLAPKRKRLDGYAWARQSALLQKVKNRLAAKFSNTKMRADGQVVMVNFGSYNVEVVPAFLLTSGHYWICNTENGGTYKEAAPWAEVNHLESVNNANSGKR